MFVLNWFLYLDFEKFALQFIKIRLTIVVKIWKKEVSSTRFPDLRDLIRIIFLQKAQFDLLLEHILPRNQSRQFDSSSSKIYYCYTILFFYLSICFIDKLEINLYCQFKYWVPVSKKKYKWIGFFFLNY